MLEANPFLLFRMAFTAIQYMLSRVLREVVPTATTDLWALPNWLISPIFTWKCLVGGAKKWKNDELLQASNGIHNNTLQAQLISKNDDHCLINFQWSSGLPFEKIIAETGKIPLPPYIKREATEDDQHRYQTVYAAHEGSVAAPTAGLHFTESLINNRVD